MIRPDKVESDVALLMINGGSNDSKAPESADAFTRLLASHGRGANPETNANIKTNERRENCRCHNWTCYTANCLG